MKNFIRVNEKKQGTPAPGDSGNNGDSGNKEGSGGAKPEGSGNNAGNNEKPKIKLS
jgi:hypothetical protein